jgi:hypothetical protein
MHPARLAKNVAHPDAPQDSCCKFRHNGSKKKMAQSETEETAPSRERGKRPVHGRPHGSPSGATIGQGNFTTVFFWCLVKSAQF